MATEANIPEDVSEKNTGLEERYSMKAQFDSIPNECSPAESIKPSSGLNEYPQCFECSAEAVNKEAVDNVGDKITIVVISSTKSPEDRSSVVSSSSDKSPTEHIYKSGLCQADNIMNQALTQISENERQHQNGVQLQSKDVEKGGDKVEAINDKNIQEHDHDIEHDGARISGLGRAEEPNLKVHEEETSMDNSSLDQHLELISDQRASFKVIPESIEKEMITSQTNENPRSKGEDADLKCNEQATSIFETNLGLINETLLPNLELTTKCQGAEDKRVIESCIKDEDIDSTIPVEDEFKEISFTGVQNKKPEMQSVLEGELKDPESIWSSDKLEHDNNGEFKLMHGSTEDASTVNVAQSPYDHSIEEFTFEAAPKNEDNDDDKLENPCSNLVTNGASTQVAIEAGETLQEASYTTCKDKNKDTYESVVPPVDRMAKAEDSACLDTEVRGANEEDSTQTELTETNENSKVNPEKHDGEKRDSLQKNEQEELGEQVILNPEMTEIAAPRENAEKRVEQNIHTVEIFEEKEKDGPTSTTDSVETSFSTEKGLPLVESITKIKSEESIFPLTIADDLNSKYPWVEETGQSDSSETGEVSKTEVQEKNKESSMFCVENNKQDKHHSEIQSLENLFIKHMDSEAMVTTKTIAKSTKDTEELEKVSETHSEEKIEIKGNGKIIQEEPKEREEATDKQLHNTEKESVSEDEAPSRLPTMALIRDETIEQSFQEESLKDGESTSIYKNKSQRPENDDNTALEVCERSKTEASVSKPEEEIENTVGTLSSASVGMKTEKAYLVEDESEETKMKQEVKVTESKGQIEATHLIERKISNTSDDFSEPKEEHVALTTEENSNNFNKYPSSVLEEFEKDSGSTNDSETEFLAVASENTVMKEVKQVNEEQFEGSDAAQEMIDVTKSNGLGSIDIAERQEEENDIEESRDMEVGDNILKVCEPLETEASVSKPEEEEIENSIGTLSSSSVGTKTGKEHPQYESEETKTKEEVDVTESKGQNEATHLVERNTSNNLDDFSEPKEDHGASTTEEKNNILVKYPSSILGEFEKDSGSNNDSESEFLRVVGENTPVKEVKPVNEEQIEGSDAPQEMVDVTTIETKSNDLSSVDIAERKKEETNSEESKNMEVGDNILKVCEPSETGASISKPEDEEIENTFGTLSSSSIATKTGKKYVEEDESEETKTKEEVEVTESKGQNEATHLIERNISNNLDDFSEPKEEHGASTTEEQLEGSDAAQDMMDVTTIEIKSNCLSNVYIAERQEEETNSEESTNKKVGDNILKACEPSESEASVSKSEDKEIENTVGTLSSSSVGMKTGKEYVEEDESEETKMKEEVEVTKSRGQNEATHLVERNIYDTLDDFSETKEEHGASTTEENNNILVKDPSSILGEFEKDSDSNNDSECGFLGVVGETTTMKEVKPVNEEQLEGSDATQEMMGITIETKSNSLSRVDIAKRQEEETNSKDSKNMEVGDNILKVCEPSETVASFSKPEDEEIENTVGTLSSSLVGMKTAKDYKEKDESEETKTKEEVEVTESKGQNEATHLVERNIFNTLDDFSDTKEEHGASSTEEKNNNIFKEPSSILGEFEKDSGSNNDSESEFLIIVGENTPVKEVKPVNEVQLEGSDAAQEIMDVTTIETKSHDLSSGDIAETRKEETNENSKVMDMEVGDKTLKVCESLETEASASKPEYEEIENTVGTLPSSSVRTKTGKEYAEEEKDESEETKTKEEVEVTESKGQNEATHLIERNIYNNLDDFSEPKEEYGASTTEEQLEGFDAAQETIHITTIETKSNCLSNVYIAERQEEETNSEESTNKEVGDNILKACEPSESEASVSKPEDEEIVSSVGMKTVKEYTEDESEETKKKEEAEVTESKGQNEATHLVERNISNTLDDFSEPKEEHGASTTEENNNILVEDPSSILGEFEKDNDGDNDSESEFLIDVDENTAMKEVKPVNEEQIEGFDATQEMMGITTIETKSNSLSSVDIVERQEEETNSEDSKDVEVVDNIFKVCEPSETAASVSKPEDKEVENTVGTLSSSSVRMKIEKEHLEEDESEETKTNEEVEVTELKGQNEATHLVERNISNTLHDCSEPKEEHGALTTEEKNNNILKEPSSTLGEFEKDSGSTSYSKSEFLRVEGGNTAMKEVKPVNEVQLEGSDAAQDMMDVTTNETKSNSLSSVDIAERQAEEICLEENREMEVGEVVDQGEQMSHDIKEKDLIMGINHETELTITGDQLVHTFTDSSMILSKKEPKTIDMSKATEKRHKDGDQPMRPDLKTENNISDSDREDIEKGKREQVDCLADLNEACKLEIVEEEKSAIEVTKHIEVYTYMGSRKALLQEENLAGKTEDNSGVIGVEREAAELKAASPRSEEVSANIKTSKLLMEKGAFVSVARDQSEDTLLHSSNNQTEGKDNNIQEKDSQSVQYIMRLKFQGDTDPNMKPRCNDEDHLNLTLDQDENTNAIEFTHQVHQKSRTADNNEDIKEHLTKGRITSPGEETRNEVKVSTTEFTERVRSTELTEGKKSITSEDQTEQNMDITESSAFKSTEASETYTEVSSSTSKVYATETEAEVIQKDDPATDDPKNVPVINETEETGLKNAGPEHVEYNKGSDIAIKNNGETAIATNKTTLDSTDIIEREEENFNPERKGILEELNEGNLKMDLEETDKTSTSQLDIELATISIPMFQDYTELSIGEKEAVGTATNYPIDERSTREDIAAETAETYLLVHTTENKLLQKEHEIAKPGGVSELESVDITKEFSNEDRPKLENEGLHMVFDQNTNNSISDTSSISYHDASSKFDTEKEEKLFVEASKCTPSSTYKDSEAIQGQENLASTFEGNTCVKIEKAATELETKDFSHEDEPTDEFPSEKTVEAADANEKVGLTSESMAKDQSDEKIYQAKEKSDSEDEIIEPREYIPGKNLQGETHREIDMQFEVEHHISVPRNEHETSVAGDCTVNVLKETEEVKGRENIPEYTQDPKSNLKDPDALYAGDKTVNEVKATNTGFIQQTEKFNKEDDNNTFETLPCTSERKDVTTTDKVQSSLDTIDTDNTKGESSNSEDSRDKQSPEIFDEGGREMNQDTRAPTTEVEHEKEENTSLTSIPKDNLQKPSVMQTEEDDPLKNKFSNAIGNLANDGQTYKNTETAFVADTAEKKPPQSNHDAIKPTVFPELGNSIIEKENANKEIQKLEDGNLHDQNSRGTISDTKDVKISIMEKGSGVTDQNGAGTPEDMENPKLCNEGSKYTVDVTSTNNERDTENFRDTLKIIVAEKIATESDLSGQSNLHESNENEKSELPAEILEPTNLGKKFESASDSKVHDETNEQLPQTREKSNNIRDCISENVEQFPETKFESEKQRNLEPQMEAEHILNILRHAKETSVTSLTAKEVHDGVDRTGGSENIEEQIIKAEVSSMGLQMLSARDETVNQVKDHNLISTKDLKTTDSSKHTAMAGLSIEDDPIRKEASSAKEASEEIMHDKGDWRPIDDPTAEIKIEKKIETGENCINMTETPPVEVQKVEASAGEAQLDNKPLEGFNLNKQCRETIKIRPGLQTEEDTGMEVEMNSPNLFAQLPHTAHGNAGRKIPFPEIASKVVELKDEDIDLSEQTLAEENLSLDGNEDETRESSEMISRHNRAAVEAISKDKTIDDQFLQKETSDEKLQAQSSASFTRKQGQETRMESKNTEENKAMETLDYNFLNIHTLEDTCLDVENFIRVTVSDSGTKGYEDCQTDCSNEVHEEGRAPDVILQLEPHEKGKKVCLDSLLENEQIKEETESEKAPNLKTSERAFENVQEDHRYEVLTEFKDKEKHLKTALIKLQPEENQSEITTAAGKTNTEVSGEKIKEEQEAAKDFQQIYVGERDRTSHQETELSAIENPIKKTNKTFQTISNDSQLDMKSESIEKEEHDNIEDNLPDDTEGKDVTEVATRLTHDNRGAETKIPARSIEVRAQSEKELGVKADVEINHYQTTKTNEDVQQVPKNPDEETIPEVQPENTKPRRATEISTRVEGTEVEEEYSGRLGEGLTEKSTSIDAGDISLSKALQRSAEESLQEAIHLDEATEVAASTVEAKTQKAETPQIAETKLDSEKEFGGGTENLKIDPLSGPFAMVETKVTDVKVAHKKSHNILSGVGSKVKHSIAKVKKAITGKSSHPKTPSPK